MFEGIARSGNAHDVALVPARIEKERPFREARAFARPGEKALDRARFADLPHTFLTRHKRADSIGFARYPLGHGYRKAPLGAEWLGLGKLAREPSPQQPFAPPPTKLELIGQAKCNCRDDRIEEGYPTFYRVSHQTTIGLGQKIVR